MAMKAAKMNVKVKIKVIGETVDDDEEEKRSSSVNVHCMRSRGTVVRFCGALVKVTASECVERQRRLQTPALDWPVTSAFRL